MNCKTVKAVTIGSNRVLNPSMFLHHYV